MLQQTQTAVPHTSWFMLRNGNGQLLEPFDYRICQVQNQQLAFTGEVYELEDGDQEALNGFHTANIQTAVNSRPNNNHIQDNSVEYNRHDVFGISEALMNDNGLAVPVAQVGVAATVKTTGASTCLPLVVRATAAVGNTPGVGCVHLSANDMTSLQNACNAILRMCTMLRGQLGDPAATCHCYLAGGSGTQEDIDNDALNDYARAVAGLQIVAARAANHVAFDGALVPAVDQDGDYINVLTTAAANAVYYYVAD